MLRINPLEKHIREVFEQGATHIIQELLEYNKQYFFRSLLECINIMISISESYPQELLQVIIHLSNPEY
jgi:CRP-like cAMP-binding protein